ncbi:hypothetical protein BC829DRAFT_257760 [Chytridium lagenaria]|nr:hypothetical protein BC829DRAFT_257760 [Chytridium lagenaria]
MILMGSGELLKPEDTKFGFAALTHLNNINSADVLIRIQDGGMYPTHRAYLQRLPSFQAHCNFKDESVQIIKLFLPAPHQFRPLLEFIYRGDDIIDPILLAPEWFLDTLRNSAFLNIETIVEACIFQFPLVFSEMLLKEDFHHTRIPLETLSRLLQVLGQV